MDYAFRIFLVMASLVFSVIFHEMSHAWSAEKMGDSTGRDMNRLSWNPIYHIDPFMTIILPLVLYVMTSGQFVFGGAKPVQVNALNFKNPFKGMMISAGIGPLSNYLLAACTVVVLALLIFLWPGLLGHASDEGDFRLTYTGFLLFTMVHLNLLLGTFNLIPIPPLDGSRVLYYFLGEKGRAFMDRIEPFGLFLIMALLLLGGLNLFILPMYVAMEIGLTALLGPDLVHAYFQLLLGSQ